MLLFSTLYRNVSRKMSVFTQKFSPLLGKVEWEVQDEKYDYHQEIARSGFADMLHDTERNHKYYLSIQKAVEQIHAQNRKANVLDIGTGTGLLSMMAAKCGADSVTACEMFEPVAACAKRIIKANGFGDRITLVPKYSLNLLIPKDMGQKANILVTEIFDTELIGEDALKTIAHARKELLEADCIVIPKSATIYAQVVESPLASGLRKIKSVVDSENGCPVLKIPESVENCFSSPSVHDLQLNQFPITHFTTIIPPTPVIHFDWTDKKSIAMERSTVVVKKVENSGVAQVVFVWWDLVMDPDGDVVLSCAPYWAHPEIEIYNNNPEVPVKDCLPWRDHWMQAFYFLPREVKVTKGQELSLISSHDKFSLWFNLIADLQISEQDYVKHVCQCGLHFAMSRIRIGQTNDATRNKKYLSVLRKKINFNTVCLCLSESSLLGLIAAKMGAKHVFCLPNLNLVQVALKKFAAENEILDRVTFLDDMDKLMERASEFSDVNLVISDPFFKTSLLPWHNLYFMRAIRNELYDLLPKNVDVMPHKAILYGIAVNFNHLYKIKGSLDNCEGFNLKIFDDMIQNSSEKADALVEPQPLWEYPGKALSLPTKIMEFQISTFNPLISQEVLGYINFEGSGVLNGVAFWIDWHLDESPKNVITTGPVIPPEFNQEIKWDMYTRQGVFLLRNCETIKQNDVLQYVIHFTTDSIKFELLLNGEHLK